VKLVIQFFNEVTKNAVLKYNIDYSFFK